VAVAGGEAEGDRARALLVVAAAAARRSSAVVAAGGRRRCPRWAAGVVILSLSVTWVVAVDD
jgi:hypothetical protein